MVTQTLVGQNNSKNTIRQTQKCARAPSAAFLVVIPRPHAPARARKTRAQLRAARVASQHHLGTAEARGVVLHFATRLTCRLLSSP